MPKKFSVKSAKRLSSLGIFAARLEFRGFGRNGSLELTARIGCAISFDTLCRQATRSGLISALYRKLLGHPALSFLYSWHMTNINTTIYTVI